MQPAVIQHIDADPARCGGKPCIAGTRIRVWDIHIWHHLGGQSPEEIVAQFPQLTVADVHAALTYYHDHRDELESQMRDAEKFVAQLEGQQGATKFSQLRDALIQNNHGGDSVSPR
jgi:uncharacterized protein (DUF433 family)